jgi:hypothetical protein
MPETLQFFAKPKEKQRHEWGRGAIHSSDNTTQYTPLG